MVSKGIGVINLGWGLKVSGIRPSSRAYGWRYQFSDCYSSFGFQVRNIGSKTISIRVINVEYPRLLELSFRKLSMGSGQKVDLLPSF